MTMLDLSRLSGPDAVTALRSFPRRYRSAVLPVDDPETEELAERVGAAGHSAVELVWHATATFDLLREALRQVLQSEDPVLHPGVVDTSEREWATPPGVSVHDALDRFTDAATGLADVVAGVHLPDWRRTARVANGGTVGAFDIVKQAVQAGADDLAGITSTLASLH